MVLINPYDCLFLGYFAPYGAHFRMKKPHELTLEDSIFTYDNDACDDAFNSTRPCGIRFATDSGVIGIMTGPAGFG